MTEEQMHDAVAAVLMRLRRCNDRGGAAESGLVPCPFCFWTLDAEDEAGCYVWAKGDFGDT